MLKDILKSIGSDIKQGDQKLAEVVNEKKLVTFLNEYPKLQENIAAVTQKCLAHVAEGLETAIKVERTEVSKPKPKPKPESEPDRVEIEALACD